MRYALILAFILGISSNFTAQADEVGGGFCRYCMNSMTTTETVEDGTDSDAKGNQPGGGSGGGGWWSMMLDLLTVEE